MKNRIFEVRRETFLNLNSRFLEFLISRIQSRSNQDQGQKHQRYLTSKNPRLPKPASPHAKQSEAARGTGGQVKPRALLICLFAYLLIFAFTPLAQASFKVPVQAQVGKFYLNLSGYISPYASVVLTIDGIFVRATVADAGGNFSISEVLIKEGFSNFCLEAVDFKRLGDSYTCFNIPPAKGNVTKREIFLPPTLGLSKNVIAEGGETLAYGYTMPGAEVTLYLSNGQKLTAFADNTGYYIFTIKNLKAGKYNLYARAFYNQKESLAPTKTLELRALSWWEQIIAFLQSILKNIQRFFSSLTLGPLWLGLPIIILIIILILKLWPEKFTFVYQSRLIIFFTRAFRKPKRPLHHAWWLGF